VKKKKIIVIVGPTAVGKSDYAVKLAKKINGEIISADSRQVYRGLNIATGKITKKEMQGIPHHMLDVVDPKKQYTASDYRNDALKDLRYIVNKNKVPIICGGTGFYISTLLGEIALADVPPNKKLRTTLANKSAVQLFKILQKLDPEKSKTIDSKNPVRLIRAIEIARAPKKKNDELGIVNNELKNFKIEKIGLMAKPEILRKRINERVLSRIKKGMIGEAKRLRENGLSFKRMRELGLEYRALADYLQNKITKEELIETIKKENWAYAKRQITWFKRDKNIRWINI
jgi:tRNA dimethylallyltransferase